MEEKLERASEHGKYTGVMWTFDGIRMGHAVSTYTGFSSFASSTENDQDVVRLHFGLKGDYAFTYKQLGKTFDLIGGHHNLMFSQGFDMVVTNKTRVIETFGVQFPKETFMAFTENASDELGRFAQAVERGENIILSDTWGAIDLSIEQVIQQILHCSYQDNLKRIFLLAKSMELLVLSAEQLGKTNRAVGVLKTKSDREKMIAVRDLINDRITVPPSLTEIAAEIGLNEYKLKRGFREMFDTTIFNYMTAQRLYLAQMYLLNTEKTSAEIAYELGYKTPQHFTAAFKKQFGRTPNVIRKNPKLISGRS